MQRPVRRRDDQIANRHHTDQLAVGLDDVEIKKSFQLAALADLVDGALGRAVGQECHEIGSHDAPDRAFRIIDDLAHGGLALGIEQREHSFAALLGQAVDEENRVVGIGAGDQPADFVLVDQGENIG